MFIEPYDPVRESLAVDDSFNLFDYLDNLPRYIPDPTPEEDLYEDVLDLIDEHVVRQFQAAQAQQDKIRRRNLKARSQAYVRRSLRRAIELQNNKTKRRIIRSEYNFII